MANYKASGNVVAAAGTAPFLSITGAANKVVRVNKIKISGITLTAVAYLRVALAKFSTANSGGTSTNPNKIGVDSGNADTSAATIAQYTVAPTPGTSLGNVAERTVLGQATTAAAAGIPTRDAEFDFGNKPIVLRSAAESLNALFAAAPASAVTLSYDIDYSEDLN